ncbi:phytanoyl-CoA dioxygenase family protein [Geminocystis sp. GBBB08]|uniref:phytanoyl-CoA dioxygenase family protein n=1 Tax=Geminocystis sp. GBBB08 TaxID=2604140 RepID=UPI0027E246FB|nr:phytanoyl-CoA dioxygenase family protein [Geminocystis sp. GBBB08]MBL1210717.1 phytanoyl-CoA dioxygenase family protein [Geminocystis sp. GBBB08]
MQKPNFLTSAQIETFNQDGFLIIKNFYDLKTEIEPIQYGIHEIINILINKYQLNIKKKEAFNSDKFDNGYQEIIAYDRKIGGEIYDAVKQIPAFVRLVASSKNEQLFQELRQTNLAGLAAGGYGIRIDNPHEEQYRAPWHQDYPAQLRSINGLVFWSPLVKMTTELGLVKFCVGSHKDGLVRVHTKDPKNPLKTGAYALILEDEKNLINRYPQIAPLSEPSDLIILDYLVIHSSGFNVGNRSRWTMQMRYFDFLESSGIKISWKGAFAQGNQLQQIHPELVID